MYFQSMLEILGVQGRRRKPREKGLTMILDKLESIDHEYLSEAAEYIDIAKIGWTLGTTVSRKYIARRVGLYREHGISVSPGGTLLELSYARGTVSRLFELLKELGFDTIEVSNGILNMTPTEKTKLIQKARHEGFKVIAEVGKKNPAYRLSLEDALAEAERDLASGAWKVIIEGREMGRATCIFDEEGDIIWDRVNAFVAKLGIDNIVFEAPLQAQQIELILNFGADVNLANISLKDVLSLETLRLGIRGDTYLLGKGRPLNVSPSARFVYFILREKGPLTIREIQGLTGLSRRTIHSALRELREKNAVKEYGTRGREKIWGLI